MAVTKENHIQDVDKTIICSKNNSSSLSASQKDVLFENSQFLSSSIMMMDTELLDLSINKMEAQNEKRRKSESLNFDNLDTEEKRFSFLKNVFISSNRNGEKLEFNNALFLIDILSQCLSDKLSRTRSLALDILTELIPSYGYDLDEHICLLLPQLLQNILHNNSVVKNSALQVLHSYFKHTTNKAVGLRYLTQKGLNSDDKDLQNEVFLALPHLLFLNFSQTELETLFTSVLKVIQKRLAEKNCITQSMIAALQHVKSKMNNIDEYLKHMDKELYNVYECTMENKDLMHSDSNRHKSKGKSEVISLATSRAVIKSTKQLKNVIFGFIPDEILIKLKSENSWQIRSDAINELMEVITSNDNDDCLKMHARDILKYLSNLVDDVNLNVGLITLNIFHKIIIKMNINVHNHLDIVINTLLKKFNDPKIVIRKIILRIALSLMHCLSPMIFIQAILPFLKHKNSRTREEIVNVITAALLSFPSSDFDLISLPRYLAPMLLDQKRRVRHASMECFAILAQQLGSGRLSPLVSAVNEIESRDGGEGVLVAVQSRLGRRTLPKISEEGLVAYALSVPANILRGEKFASDVTWILAGVIGKNGEISKRDSESSRNLSSAGRKKLPWQNTDLKELESPRKLAASAPAKANQNDVVTGEESTLKQSEMPGALTSNTNQIDSNLERFLTRSKLNQYRCSSTENQSHSDSQGSYFEMYKTQMKKLKTAGLQADSNMIYSIKPYAVLPQAYKQHKDGNIRLETVRSPVNNTSSVLSPTDQATQPCIMSPTETEKIMGISTRPTLARSASKTKQRIKMNATRNSDNGEDYLNDKILSHTLPMTKFDECSKRRISLDGLSSPFPSRPTIHRSPSGRLSRHQPAEKHDFSQSNLKNMKKLSNSSPVISSANKESKNSLGFKSTDKERSQSPVLRNSFQSKKISPVSPLRSPILFPLNDVNMQTKADSTTSLDSLEEQYDDDAHPGTPKLAKSAQEKIRKHREDKQLRQSTDTLIVLKRNREHRLSHSIDTVDGFKKRSSLNDSEVSDNKLMLSQNKEEQLRLISERETSWKKGAESENARNCQVINHDDIPVGNLKKRQKKRDVANGNASFDIPLVRHELKRDTNPFGNSDYFEIVPEQVQERWQNDDVVEKVDQNNSPRSNSDNSTRLNDTRRSRKDNLEIAGERMFHKQQKENTNPSTEQSITNKEKLAKDLSLDVNNNEDKAHDLMIKGRRTKNSPCGTQPKVANSPQVSRRMKQSASSSDYDGQTSPGKTNGHDLEQEITNPQQAISNALQLLGSGSEEWESKCDGLVTIKRVCRFYADSINDLHVIVDAVLTEVKNLRSQVTRLALNTIGEMFVAFAKPIEVELEIILKTVLPKVGDTNKFIRADVELALNNLVQHIHPSKAMAAVIATGVHNKNDLVRRACAKCIADISENVGASRLMSIHKDIIPVVGKLATDRNEDARYHARRILFLLRDHPDLDRLLEKHLPSVNLRLVRDVIENLKAKGMLEPPGSGLITLRMSTKSSLPSPGLSRRSRNASSANSAVKKITKDETPLPETERSSGRAKRSQQNGNRQDKNATFDMSCLANLDSKEWQERLEALDNFYDLVSMNPSIVAAHPIKLFDLLCPRLNDSNSKVNLFALDVLKRVIPIAQDHMAPAMTILIDNLKAPMASKNDSIYQAATDCLLALTENIDGTYLIQPLVTSIQHGNVRTKPEFAERLADIIQPVFSRKPGLITRLVLPLVWNLLSTQISGAVTSGRANLQQSLTIICKLLYECIGEEFVNEANTKGSRTVQRLESILQR